MAQKTSLSGITAIIIGAGYGGLSASIELALKGADVQVFESYPDMTKQGDVIQVPANATRLMSRWGDVLSETVKESALPTVLAIQNKDGKLLLDQQLHTEFGGFPNVYSHRGRIQKRMFDEAVKHRVRVSFGAAVTEVFEEGDSAGVIVGGIKYTADVVLASDGVHSRTRVYVTGAVERPKKSGFAVYRSWFPLSQLKNDPVTRSIYESKKDIFLIWIAENTHAILTTNRALQTATCFVTHKDHSDVVEDWNLPGDVQDMLACVEEWDPVLRHIIQSIPPECLIDYKLLWRDPVPKWVSNGGRVCLLGDAAHPHLATSGTGAAQAIEDAATIAVVLEKVGKQNIPIALKCYEKLRYERTSLTQRMGWETRHVWHQTDWNAVASNPEFLKLPQPAWLLGVDAVDYAEENIEAVKSHLLDGAPFQSKNVPPGHIHEDWNIEMMLSHEGKKVDEDFYKTRE
uniref:FAD-binding domain-containing protein n=1 Tax=Bionectria ochroleuca TaxID=29856 RepID=A0A8H7K389_BIOOC